MHLHFFVKMKQHLPIVPLTQLNCYDLPVGFHRATRVHRTHQRPQFSGFGLSFSNVCIRPVHDIDEL